MHRDFLHELIIIAFSAVLIFLLDLIKERINANTIKTEETKEEVMLLQRYLEKTKEIAADTNRKISELKDRLDREREDANL